MLTLKLDENNNIELETGSFSFLENEFATAQDIARSLHLDKGENPLNTDEGIDWEEDILGKMGGLDYIKSQLRNRILKNSEVIDIESMTVERINDVLSVNTKINTIYGVINV